MGSVCLVNYLLPQPFDMHQIDVFEKPMRLRVFNLKTESLTSDNSFVTIGYELSTTQNFLKHM